MGYFNFNDKTPISLFPLNLFLDGAGSEFIKSYLVSPTTFNRVVGESLAPNFLQTLLVMVLKRDTSVTLEVVGSNPTGGNGEILHLCNSAVECQSKKNSFSFSLPTLFKSGV
jgi:hypothetical protein